MKSDNNGTAVLPATQSRTRSVSRIVGLGVTAALWAATIILALHTSRFPEVLGKYSKDYFFLLLILAGLTALVSLLQLPRVQGWLYRGRYALVFILVICPLITLGMLEFAMRAFNLFGSNFYSDIRRYTTHLELDPNVYFKNPANYHGKYSTFEISTNNVGLRQGPVTPPAPGEERVLMLGDSVTFGWGVNVEEAFPHQVEIRMAAAGHPVQAINSGVIGYNSRQELAYLKLHGDELRPKAVILMYVDNDIEAIDPQRVHLGVLPNPLKDPKGAADYFLSMSRVYFMVHQIGPVIWGGPSRSLAEKRASAGWKDSMDSVAAMARYCRERGIPFAVFFFRMTSDPVSDALQADLIKEAGEDNFYYCDTLPWFQGKNFRQLTNSFIDIHPNGPGHAILADGITQFMLQKHMVDHGAVH